VRLATLLPPHYRGKRACSGGSTIVYKVCSIIGYSALVRTAPESHTTDDSIASQLALTTRHRTVLRTLLADVSNQQDSMPVRPSHASLEESSSHLATDCQGWGGSPVDSGVQSHRRSAPSKNRRAGRRRLAGKQAIFRARPQSPGHTDRPPRFHRIMGGKPDAH